MTTKLWAQLPNSTLIANIIEDFCEHDDKFNEVEEMLDWDFAQIEQDCHKAYDMVNSDPKKRKLYKKLAKDMGLIYQERYAGPFKDAYEDCIVVSSAILALLAYEDCAHYLELTSDQLQMIAALSDLSAPRMLAPFVRAREMIGESQ